MALQNLPDLRMRRDVDLDSFDHYDNYVQINSEYTPVGRLHAHLAGKYRRVIVQGLGPWGATFRADEPGGASMGRSSEGHRVGGG